MWQCPDYPHRCLYLCVFSLPFFSHFRKMQMIIIIFSLQNRKLNLEEENNNNQFKETTSLQPHHSFPLPPNPQEVNLEFLTKYAIFQKLVMELCNCAFERNKIREGLLLHWLGLTLRCDHQVGLIQTHNFEISFQFSESIGSTWLRIDQRLKGGLFLIQNFQCHKQ